MAIEIAKDAYLSSDSNNIIFTFKVPKTSTKGKNKKKDGTAASNFKWKTLYYQNLHVAVGPIIDHLVKRHKIMCIKKNQTDQNPEALKENLKTLQDLGKVIRAITKELQSTMTNIKAIDLIGKVKFE